MTNQKSEAPKQGTEGTPANPAPAEHVKTTTTTETEAPAGAGVVVPGTDAAGGNATAPVPGNAPVQK